MEFNVITISLMSVAFISLVIGAVLLIRFDWFKGWLIGSAGLGSLVIAILSCVIILSFNSFMSSRQSDSVGSISFTKVAPKHYKVEIVETQGEKSVIELHGDLWQVDATILGWSGFFEQQGLTPYYRLDRISSSYSMLKDAETLPHSTIQVESGIADAILKQLALSESVPFLTASKGSTGALPMQDGALFSIRLTKAGLVSKPENQQAFASTR